MLERLPPELTARVVSFLDCFSVRDLLQTLPTIRRLAVLVVCGEESEPVQFFNIPQLRKVSLSDYVNFCWIRESHLIKLFEVSSRESASSSGRKGEMRDWLTMCHTVLDPLSFVHLNNSSFHDFLYLTTNTLGLKMPGLNGSKFVESWDEGAPYMPFALTFLDRHYPPDAFSKLEDLHITANEDMQVCGLELPIARTLSIRFPKSDVMPVLSDIRVPLVKLLRVHFSGSKLPLIFDIDVGKTIRKRKTFPFPSKDLGLEHHRSFELCHTEGFDFKTPSPTEASPFVFDMHLYQHMDFLFTEYFQRITLVGTPENLLRVICPLYCRVFQYYRTIKYIETIPNQFPPQVWGSSVPICLYPSNFLAVLVFKTNLENVVFPRIMFAPLLETLVIYTTAKGLHLNNLFNNQARNVYHKSFTKTLRRLSIVCDLQKDEIGGDGHVLLEWYDLQSISASFHLTSIHIEGCYFGPNNQLLIRDELGFEVLSDQIKRNTPHKLLLGLVRSQAGGATGWMEDDTLLLCLFQPLVKVNLVEFFQVSQLTGRSALFRPWRAFEFPVFPTRHHKKGCQLRLSTSFEQVFVNQKELLVCPMQPGASPPVFASGSDSMHYIWELPGDGAEDFELVDVNNQ